VVVFDSVQQVFAGVDENNAGEVGDVFRSLFRLRDTLGVAILLIHHKPKTGPYKRELIEMVRGSTAFTTQSSTSWLATRQDETMELRQAKRRGGGKLKALRIRYEADGEDGPIRLTGEPLEKAELELERVSEWIIEYVGERGTVRTKYIQENGKAAGFSERTITNALKFLVDKLGALEKPVNSEGKEMRGYYRVPEHDNQRDLEV
jgi:hypothetical protein